MSMVMGVAPQYLGLISVVFLLDRGQGLIRDDKLIGLKFILRLMSIVIGHATAIITY